MAGEKGGEGIAGRCILGLSPFDPALERAHAQVAASIQVQVKIQLTFCLLPGALLDKA